MGKATGLSPDYFDFYDNTLDTVVVPNMESSQKTENTTR